MNSLDSILGGGEAVTETKQDTTTQAVTETAGQATEQTTETTETEQPGAEPGKQAPIGAIRNAEREKADKRYTAVLENLRQEIATRDQAWEQRLSRALEAGKPKAEPKPAPDWYVEPDAAFEHKLTERVSPQFDRINQVMVHNSRLIASQLHTEEAVTAADNAFAQAVANRTVDPADYQKVLNSPNIYDAAVKWHKSKLAQEEIGPDPAAYKAKLEAEIRAKLEAELGQPETVTQQPGQRSAVMPSNLATARNVGARSGPAWGGPTPLNDIFNRNKRTA